MPRTPDLAPPQPGFLPPEARRLRIVIVSEVRFLREGLAEFLERDPSVSVVKVCADLAELVALSSSLQADVVLVDGALRDGVAAARRNRQIKPDMRIIAYDTNQRDLQLYKYEHRLYKYEHRRTTKHSQQQAAVGRYRQPVLEPRRVCRLR